MFRKCKNKIKEKRIGIIICHCGKNISSTINFKELVNYSKNLQDVVFVKDIIYLCSNHGLKKLKNAIKENNLNRVVIAACTPRTHEQLFKRECEKSGLNKYLIEFVNIREQCSWIHIKEKEMATKKAKKLIDMAVAKARLLVPKEDFKIDIVPSTLVIGCGISGMISAISLANSGFNVYIVEKENKVGGMLNKLYKLYPKDVEAENFVKNLGKKVKENEKIRLYLSRKIKEVEGYIGNFNIKIENKINRKLENLKVGTIIVATGAETLDPGNLYKYNKYKNVITQLELERILKNRLLNNPNNIVMIQCVGARGQGISYCSKICCMTAIKNAKIIKEIYPNCKVYILHRDIQAKGKDYENYYRIAREKGVIFIRFDEDKIPKVSRISDSEKLNIKVYNSLLNRNIVIIADFLVLSTPLIPKNENRELAKILNVELDEENFFKKAQPKLKTVDFNKDGIFFCGTANSPIDIKESIQQALSSASRAEILMSNGFIKVSAITTYVNMEECIGCGNCKIACPYNAIELIKTDHKIISSVNPAICKGCGNCISSCPNGAIQQYSYTDKQFLNMVNALSKDSEE